ncbi:DnaA regulatory inactivator HdaA [Aquibium sp. A9E412]|uniref:DnaA regulatory inactivator HdaA n=1 Tax=Aquibium sp. A9E412 TaxID=2976767 RepID=UPI0025B24A14|nr:DnaA regulatory inactivator HdaA [Aquibium sp. A9E412]MDN2564992.1 DnaA regulatory inactivator HdaA [Aquibium sp. A9E412]
MVSRARQLPLALDHHAGFTRDDLVVSAANREAVALIEAWPDWPAPVAVLAGPPGAGKSHLAAIWRARSGAAAFAAHDIGPAAIAAAALGPVCIDDADAPGRDEAGLFHLVNAVRAAGHHLMLTARRLPAAWDVALPDLASRLRAAAAVEIGPPDEATLAAVITKLFADRQVAVEPRVVQYLVRRIERSLSAANAVVDRLDRAALERKAPITRALAAAVIGPQEADAPAHDR